MGEDGVERDHPGRGPAAVGPQLALRRAEGEKRAGAELLNDGAISTSIDFPGLNSGNRESFDARVERVALVNLLDSSKQIDRERTWVAPMSPVSGRAVPSGSAWIANGSICSVTSIAT